MKEALVPLLVPTLIFFMLSAAPFVHAADSSDENLQKIKEPLERIYTVVQTLISIVAVLVITFAGFRFMASGENIQARKKLKQLYGYPYWFFVVTKARLKKEYKQFGPTFTKGEVRREIERIFKHG